MAQANKDSIPPLSDHDQALLAKFSDVINGDERPMLVGREGAHVQFPEPIFHILTKAVRMMTSGQLVTLLSANEEFTTKAAADFLGMSRPHLVKLLEEKHIPFHFVGTHRRIYLSDLKAFEASRRTQRRESLDKLNERIMDAGLYDSDYMGDE